MYVCMYGVERPKTRCLTWRLQYRLQLMVKETWENRDNGSQCDAPRDCCMARITVTLMDVRSSSASFLFPFPGAILILDFPLYQRFISRYPGV